MAKKKNKKKLPVPSSTPQVVINTRHSYIPLSVNWSLISLFIFVGFSFLLYFQTLPFGYVLDDKIAIVDNNYTKKGIDGIGDLLSSDTFEGYFGEQKNLVQGGRYRPLSLISFAIEHEFFGLNPMLSHLINIILYGLCGFLMLITLRRLFSESKEGAQLLIGLSFLTSLLFIAHPIHTEAVANIKGRDEIMAFIFSIWGWLLTLKYYDTEKIKYLIMASLVVFLGLMSKENVLTFFAIIPLSLILFRKADKKKILSILASLLIGIIIYLFIRYNVIGYFLGTSLSKDVMNNPFVEMNITQKYATIFYTLLKYIQLCFVPFPLTHDYYPYHIPIMEWGKLSVVSSLLLHLSMAFAFFKFWKKDPIISFSIGFYIIALSIVSNLVVNVGTFMNERFAFTASMGICLLILYVIQKWGIKVHKLFPIICSAFIITIYSVLTVLHVPVWESELTLNTSAIKVSKNSARANSFMGTALFNKYKVTKDRNEKRVLLDQASTYVNKSLDIMPRYGNANLMKAGIAAEYHKMGGSLNDLLAEYKKVISINPSIGFVSEYLEYINNREDPTVLANFYYDVGNNLLIGQQKNYKWGVHFLKFGYELDPNNPAIKKAMSQAYKVLGINQ